MADSFHSKAQRVSANVGLYPFLIVTVYVLLLGQVATKPHCELGWYYDDVTGNCDHCSDICEHAEAMGTIQLCDRKCPGYPAAHTPKECPPDHYYDVTVKRCHSCESLCLNAGIRGTEKDCGDLCPDWSEIRVDPASSLHNDSTTHQELSDKDAGQSLPGGNVTKIIMAVLGVVVTLFGVSLCVVAVICCTKRRNKPIKKPCNKRPQQVQQMESHELESLTGRGDPPSHPRDNEG